MGLKKSVSVIVIFFNLPMVSGFSKSREIQESRLAQAISKELFSVDDSLELDAFNGWSAPPWACSKDKIAYAVIDRYYERQGSGDNSFFIPQGSHIFIKSLSAGVASALTEGPEYSWSPAWSPRGDKLAFYVFRSGRVFLGLWDAATQKIAYLDGGELAGRGEIFWSPGGDKIYFSSNPLALRGRLKPYEQSEDPIIRTSWQETNPYDERFVSYYVSQIKILDLATKKVVEIMTKSVPILAARLSPDGEHLAVLEIVKHKIRVALVPTINTLTLFSTTTGDRQTVFTESEATQFSWSPDGAHLAYIDNARLFVYSLAEKQSYQISAEGVQCAGDPVWLPGSREIFCGAGRGYYLFRVKPKRTQELVIDLPMSRPSYVLDSTGRNIFFRALDEEKGRQGIYRVKIKGGKGEELLMGDWLIASMKQVAGSLFFTLQNAATPENVWRFDLASGKKTVLTDLNSGVSSFTFGREELISWKSHSGDPLKGVLLYPANYERGKTYPVIFWVYETFSSELHHFYLHLYNLQVLTNQGYAVFLPDVEFVTGDTTASYSRAIEPALDKLNELGMANGNFGVMGHSFGGYATNAIVTQTKRFKAAVAISGISDWVSFHGLPGDFMRLSNERGQGRMGGDLREFPDRYVKNSPVFFLHQVETPLMIIHGTEDYGVPFSQAEEMYYGLRHLKKTAVLVGYPGEDHLYWETKISVIKDMWQRILSWFDKYLK